MPTAYKQGDARWALKIVGFGTKAQNFANVGCTVCDITYLFNVVTNQNVTPDVINDRLKAAGAFVGAAVLWTKVASALPALKFVYRDYNYNNPLVWAWINVWPRLPVLVEVYKKESVTKRHWVLYLGSQKMYDPIRGQIISTSSAGYTPATGSARFSRG